MPRKKGSKNKDPLKSEDQKKKSYAYLYLAKDKGEEFNLYLAKARIILDKPNLTSSQFLRWCFNHSKDYLDWELEKTKNIEPD